MEAPVHPAVLQLLRLLAARLEAWRAGDAHAFDGLDALLDAHGIDDDTLAAAADTLRHIADAPIRIEAAHDPGAGTHRVASAEERARLEPSAWGYLLALRQRGALDAEQFERVLDTLVSADVRPVPVALAREVATRVVLDVDAIDWEPYGEIEHPH